MYVFKEQSHPGRLILAHEKHISEMIELTDQERNAFLPMWQRRLGRSIRYLSPTKVNYGAYGDTGCHLHMHLVPKYEGGAEWGGVFEMNPGKVLLTDKEYEEIAEKSGRRCSTRQHQK